MEGTVSSEQGDPAREGEIEAVTQQQEASAEIESASLNEGASLANGDAPADETPVEVNGVSSASDASSNDVGTAQVDEVKAESASAPARSQPPNPTLRRLKSPQAKSKRLQQKNQPSNSTALRLWSNTSAIPAMTTRPSSTGTSSTASSCASTGMKSWSTSARSPRASSRRRNFPASRRGEAGARHRREVLVFVVQPENQEGHAVVSIDRARQEKSWRKLQEIYEANEVIEAEVTNYNKGGLLVNLDGVRGFVPASQVSEIRGGDDASKQADMARLIGSSLPLKVIEINRHRNRLILSERQAIQERRDVMKEKLIEELKEGEVRKGRVSSICDFGAFVDIGGADGLVHLSELSWSRVRHPSEVLKVGQEIDVYVLGINAQEKKIALSIKRTQAEPWSRVAANYEVGQLVRGTVTQLANFGAFARIEDGIEGLIHVSELTDERITHPKQVVREGQELLLRIIRIDPAASPHGPEPAPRARHAGCGVSTAVLGEGGSKSAIESSSRSARRSRPKAIDLSVPIEAPSEESSETGESAETTRSPRRSDAATVAEEAPAAEAAETAIVETAAEASPSDESPVATEAPAEPEPQPKAASEASLRRKPLRFPTISTANLCQRWRWPSQWPRRTWSSVKIQNLRPTLRMRQQLRVARSVRPKPADRLRSSNRLARYLHMCGSMEWQRQECNCSCRCCHRHRL